MQGAGLARMACYKHLQLLFDMAIVLEEVCMSLSEGHT